jgi:CubicO group peptidase (beta-lactamase class C family)
MNQDTSLKWPKSIINGILVLIVLICNTSKISAQALPDSIKKKIDDLFKDYDNTKSSPGCVIGIVKKDSLVYSKGYGFANLEYNISNRPSTIYYMASVSKQFTAYSIMLLVRQGKIKLDDDICLYLPWANSFGKKITIRNLLNHTSGIRDHIALSSLIGKEYNNFLTQDLALSIIKQQRSLNFNPGEQFSYSNSNYILLAEIIRSVSRKTLRYFADSAIIKPLGMVNTHFRDDPGEPIKNRAYGYIYLGDSRYNNRPPFLLTVGDAGLFSNINDMAKWVANFYNTKAGDSLAIHLFTQNGTLASGRKLNYASGIIVDTYRGYKDFYHSGSGDGVNTFICVFPDLKFGILVFGNSSNFDAEKIAFDIASIFIRDTITKTRVALALKPDSNKATLKDISVLKNYTGNYISQDGVQIEFSLIGAKLYANDYFKPRFLLIPDHGDTYSSVSDPAAKFIFSHPNSNHYMLTMIKDGEKRILEKCRGNISYTDAQLSEYVGEYKSPELNYAYKLTLKDHHLILTSNDYFVGSPIIMADPNHLLTYFWWMGHLLILRNNHNQVVGFEVNSGQNQRILFSKIIK